MKFLPVQPQLAAKSIVVLLSLVLLFHLFVMAGLLPHTIVWGGRLQTNSELLQFEAISIATNLLLILAAAARAWWPLRFPPALLRALLWLMAGLFLLNTIGNIFSNNRWEQVVFTPITLVLAGLCLQAAKGLRQATPAQGG